MDKNIKATLTKFTISEEEFRDMVTVRRMSDAAIGRQLGVCSVTVQHWRKKLGVERSFARKEVVVSQPRRKPRLSEDQLRTLYVDLKLPQRVIAEQCGVTQVTVANWLSRYGIVAMSPGGRISVVLDKEELRGLYVEKKWSMERIAKHFLCGETTVRQNIIRYGFQVDGKEVARRRIANNPDLYPLAHEHRGYVSVMKRDHPDASRGGYVLEHRLNAESAIGRYLAHDEQVHHINFVKRDNRPENLAVLPSREMHRQFHNYMERVAVYLCGLSDIRPEPLDFQEKVFWGGQWVTSIDFVGMAERRMIGPEAASVRALTRSIKENGLKFDLAETVN